MQVRWTRVVVFLLGFCGPRWPMFGQAPFVRGDVDGDAEVTLADALTLLRSLSQRTTLPCQDAADFDDDGTVSIADYGFLVDHIIGARPRPANPFPEPAGDPTDDLLQCTETVPSSVEEGAAYSATAIQIGDGVRLRISLENRLPAVGGRLQLKLPQGWDPQSTVAEVRSLLDLATVLGEDHILTAEVRPDGNLTILWVVRLPPLEPAYPAGGMRPLVDVVLCPGTTPAGEFEFAGQGEGEIVGEDLRLSTASVQNFKVAINSPGEACDIAFPNRLTARSYFWLGDAEARPGEIFRVPFYSMANVEHSGVQNYVRWDPKVLRVVGLVKVRPESTVEAMFGNLDRDVPGDAKYHDIVGSFFRVYYCDPCDAVDPSRSFVAFFASLHNFHYLGKPRPDLNQPDYRPYTAFQVFHDMDLVLQVLLTAQPGETEVKLGDNGVGGGLEGDVTASNHISFRDGIDDLYHIRPRPYTRNRITIVPGKPRISFTRGDVDLDGVLTVNDPVRLLNQLFLGSLMPLACPDSADANDDGSLDLTDAVSILGYLFLGGAEPRDPFPFPGSDKTEDTLPCGE